MNRKGENEGLQTNVTANLLNGSSKCAEKEGVGLQTFYGSVTANLLNGSSQVMKVTKVTKAIYKGEDMGGCPRVFTLHAICVTFVTFRLENLRKLLFLFFLIGLHLRLHFGSLPLPSLLICKKCDKLA